MTLYRVSAVRPPIGRERASRSRQYLVVAESGEEAILALRRYFAGSVWSTYPWEFVARLEPATIIAL